MPAPTTVTKPKHPGRVEAGKRLAEWNRKNRQKKNDIEDEVTNAPEEKDYSYVYIVGGLAVVAIASAVYLRLPKKPIIPEQPQSQPTVISKPTKFDMD